MEQNQDALTAKLENCLVEGVQKIAEVRYGSLAEQYLTDIKTERIETRAEFKTIFKDALEASQEAGIKGNEGTRKQLIQYDHHLSQLQQTLEQGQKEMTEAMVSKHDGMISAIKDCHEQFAGNVQRSQSSLNTTLEEAHLKITHTMG
jgi:hypothetical protein